MQRILIVAFFIVILIGCSANKPPECNFNEGDIVATISNSKTVIGHVYATYYKHFSKRWTIQVRMLVGGNVKGFKESELIRTSKSRNRGGKYER